MSTAKQVKMRRGSTLDNDLFTGAEGEITVDLTVGTARVHDGLKLGGNALALADLTNVPEDTSFEQRIMEAVQALIAAGGTGGSGSGDEEMFVGGVKEAYGLPGADYVPANGQLLKKTDNPELFAALGDTYSLSGNGAAPSTMTPTFSTYGAGNTTSYVLPNGNVLTFMTNSGAAAIGSAMFVVGPNGIEKITYFPGIIFNRLFLINGTYTAIGIGKTATSTDGLTWTTVNNNLTAANVDLVYTGGKLVTCVSTSPYIFTQSTDGITWTAGASTTTITSAWKIYYSQKFSLFYVANTTFQIWSSPDLSTWTARQSTSVTNGGVASIMESGDKLVFNASQNSVASGYYTTNGTTFTACSMGAYQGIMDGYGIYSAVLGRYFLPVSGSILSSTDGIAWSVYASATSLGAPGTSSNKITSWASTPTGLIAVSVCTSGTYSGQIINITSAGATSLPAQNPRDFSVVSVDPTNTTMWLTGSAAGSLASNFIRSTDGGVTSRFVATTSGGSSGTPTIVARNRAVSITVNGVSKQLCILVTGNSLSSTSTLVHYSEGQGLNTQTINVGVGRVQGLFVVNNTFVAYGHTGLMAKSTDGLTWTSAGTLGANDHIYGMGYNGTDVLVVTSAGNIFTSKNLSTWTPKATAVLPATVPANTLNSSANWDVLWTGDRWVISNKSATVAISSDAVTWSTLTVSSPISAMAYGNSKLVLMAANSTFSVSNYSMVEYSATTVGIKTNRAIVFGNGVFVIAGGDFGSTPTGNVVFNTSVDGLSWNAQTMPALGAALRLVFADGYFAAQSTYYANATTLTAIWTSADGVRWSLAGTTQVAATTEDLFSQPGLGYSTLSSAQVLSVDLTDPAYFRVPYIPPSGPYAGNNYIKLK